MNRFKVYFEIYGKKMVAEVNATDSSEAEYLIQKKIIFHKTELVGSVDKKNPIDIPDIFKQMLGL